MNIEFAALLAENESLRAQLREQKVQRNKGNEIIMQAAKLSHAAFEYQMKVRPQNFTSITEARHELDKMIANR